MYCTRCGALLTEGAAFCRHCGRAVLTSPSAAALDDSAVPPTSAPPAAVSIPAAYPTPPFTPAVPSTARLPYAGFWLRLVAYLIDNAVVSVAFGALVAIAISFIGWDKIRGMRPGLEVNAKPFGFLPVLAQQEFNYRGQFNFLIPGLLAAILSVLLATTVVTWLYYALMESSSHQGTLGKMALGLIVTDLHGQRISFGRATSRFFAKFITGLIPFFIGYMMAGFTERKQALHDIIASCLVLRKP